MNKRVLQYLFIFLLLVNGVYAAQNTSMGFSMQLTQENTVFTGIMSITASVYEQETGGTAIATQVVPTTFQDGYGAVIFSNTSSIDFSHDNWIGFKIPGKAEMTPRLYLLPAAGALDNPFTISQNNITLKNSDASIIGTLNVSGQLLINGTPVCTTATCGGGSGTSNLTLAQVMANMGNFTANASTWATCIGTNVSVWNGAAFACTVVSSPSGASNLTLADVSANMGNYSANSLGFYNSSTLPTQLTFAQIATNMGNFTFNASTWATCIGTNVSVWNGAAFACTVPSSISYQSSAAGWTNTSTQTYTDKLVNITNDISIGNGSMDATIYSDSGILYINATNVNITAIEAFVNNSRICTASNGACASIGDNSTFNQTLTSELYYGKNTNLLGFYNISTLPAGLTLAQVMANMGNFTANVSTWATCIGTNVSVWNGANFTCTVVTGTAVGGSGGGWTNTSTQTQTSLTVNISNDLSIGNGSMDATIYSDSGILYINATTVNVTTENAYVNNSRICTSGNGACASVGDNSTFNQTLTDDLYAQLSNNVSLRNGTNSNISGVGTSGTYTKFTGSGTIGDALITESGTIVTLAANTSLGGELDFNYNIAKQAVLFPMTYQADTTTPSNIVPGWMEYAYLCVERGICQITANRSLTSGSLDNLFTPGTGSYVTFNNVTQNPVSLNITFPGGTGIYVTGISILHGWRNSKLVDGSISVLDDNNNDGTYTWSTLCTYSGNTEAGLYCAVNRWRLREIRINVTDAGDGTDTNKFSWKPGSIQVYSAVQGDTTGYWASRESNTFYGNQAVNGTLNVISTLTTVEKVGINNSAPAVTLDVKGRMQVNSSGTTSGAINLLSGASASSTDMNIGRTGIELQLGIAGATGAYATGAVAGDGVIRTNAANKLHLLSGSGNVMVTVAGTGVGINTSSPTSVFHVTGQDANFFSATTSQNLKSGRNANEYINLYVDDAKGLIEVVQDENTAGGGYLELVADDDGTADGYIALRGKSVTLANSYATFGKNNITMRLPTNILGSTNITGNLTLGQRTIYPDEDRLGIGTPYATRAIHVPASKGIFAGEFTSPWLGTGIWQNFLLQTEDLTSATWVKNAVTVSAANQITDVRTSATAEWLNGTTAIANMTQGVVNTVVGNWTLSCYMKDNAAAGGAEVALLLQTNAESGTTKGFVLTNQWDRYHTTEELTTAHASKNITIVVGPHNISVWGCQLEPYDGPNQYGGAQTTGGTTSANTEIRSFSNFRTTGTFIAGGDVLAQSSDVYDDSGDLVLSGEDNQWFGIDYNSNDLQTSVFQWRRNTNIGTGTGTGDNILMSLTENGSMVLGSNSPGNMGRYSKLSINVTSYNNSQSGTLSNALDIFNYSGSSLLLLQGDGDLGLGTATPVQKLDVVGSINVTMNNGCVYVANTWKVCGNTTDLVAQTISGTIRLQINSTCSALKGDDGSTLGAGSGC